MALLPGQHPPRFSQPFVALTCSDASSNLPAPSFAPYQSWQLLVEVCCGRLVLWRIISRLWNPSSQRICDVGAEYWKLMTFECW
jgi:hypothetical protein